MRTEQRVSIVVDGRVLRVWPSSRVASLAADGLLEQGERRWVRSPVESTELMRAGWSYLAETAGGERLLWRPVPARPAGEVLFDAAELPWLVRDLERLAESERARIVALHAAVRGADEVTEHGTHGPLTVERVAELFDVPAEVLDVAGLVESGPVPVDPALLAGLGRQVAVEWGWSMPGSRSTTVVESEVLARELASRHPGSSVSARLVGPWVRRDG